MTRTRKWLIVGSMVTLSALTLIGAALVYSAWSTAQATEDVLASTQALVVIEGYLNAHEGEWPRGRDELAPIVAKTFGNLAPMVQDRLDRRIIFNWRLDPDAFLAAKSPKERARFKAFQTRSGIVAGADPVEFLPDMIRAARARPHP